MYLSPESTKRGYDPLPRPELPREVERDGQVGSRRRPGPETFLPRGAAGHRVGVLRRHTPYLVEVAVARATADEPDATALDPVRAGLHPRQDRGLGRLYGDASDLGPRLPQPRVTPTKQPAVPT